MASAVAEQPADEPAAAATATESASRKRKSRLIVRLAAFIVAHSVLVSVLCCMAGFIALLLLPFLAKNTYVSENALIPGSANPMFSGHDVLEANKFVKFILDRSSKDGVLDIGISKLIQQHMEDVGAEVYYHKFQSHGNYFSPLHFFSSTTNKVMMQTNSSCTPYGVNSVGIIRAPRGDGKEAIVLVTPYNSENMVLSEALSLGLGFSVFSLLSRVSWLAKDIVWLAADSRYGEYTSVSTWLEHYHNPVFASSSGEVVADVCSEESNIDESDNNMVKGMKSNVFKRAGTMAAALVFKVTEKEGSDERDSLTIYSEASNGQMPNLDLINVVHYLAVHRQGLRVKVGTIGLLLHSGWVKLVGEIMEGLGKLAASLNPKWRFDITSADYSDGAATLASSMYHQALGVPTGPHGAFRDYQVDAITLDLSPRTSLNNKNDLSEFILRNGRLIEGTVRSVNNLLEKFHQSFFLYFLTGPNKFVSVGVYMIAFALLVAPLPIAAAALFSGNGLSNSTGPSNEDPSYVGAWKWLPSAKVVFIAHLWGVAVSLMPIFIARFPHMTSTASMVAWITGSASILVIAYMISGSPYSDVDWRILKAVMISAACIGLGLMSVINFSTAQIGAMIVVPMCLMVRPLRGRGVAMASCNVVLGVAGFPPAALLMLRGLAEGFVGVGNLWEWAELLWAWNSATYLYLVLVHLPCWLLCMHILLHP